MQFARTVAADAQAFRRDSCDSWFHLFWTSIHFSIILYQLTSAPALSTLLSHRHTQFCVQVLVREIKCCFDCCAVGGDWSIGSIVLFAELALPPMQSTAPRREALSFVT